MSGKEELDQEIAEAEALLSRLEAEEEGTRTRLAALRVQLAALEADQAAVRVHGPATQRQPIPQNAGEKVR